MELKGFCLEYPNDFLKVTMNENMKVLTLVRLLEKQLGLERDVQKALKLDCVSEKMKVSMMV